MEGQGPGYILKTNTNHFNLQLSPTGPILTAYSRRTNDVYGDYFVSSCLGQMFVGPIYLA